MYARAGIPEAWLVDLPSDAIEVHRRPGAGGYGEVLTLGRGERIAPTLLPDVGLAVDEVLG